MSQFVSAVFFGFVQGVTEFLPVSSSGHLLILHQIFNISLDGLIFDVSLHLGTLFALLLFFRRRLLDLFKGVFVGFKKGKANFRLAFGIVIATIPAALAGLLWEDIIDFYLRNLTVVSLTLIIVGILLIIFDKRSVQQKDFYSLKPFEIFLIGIAQAFALIPGVSRSGITIIAGLGLKLQRKAAAELSFLLAIPIVFGAGMKKTLDLPISNLSSTDIGVLIVGILSSFIVGYLALKYFIKFVETYSLAVFGWYRIIVGLILLLWLFF